MKKTIIMIMVIVCILTITVSASCREKWAKELDSYEHCETKNGVLVIETNDGCRYMIEFDNDAGYFGAIEIDEDGNVDENYWTYAEADVGNGDDGTVARIMFYHN